ncbi:hypothetical protein FACS18949_18410 [Clostridia bacterium]|nr:hypothetical protein FACS18949_18410 [Clostridia bacterium]
MKLIEVAREQRDLLNEGIAWIAVWKQTQKNGTASWFSEDIFPDGGTENDEPIFDEEQETRLGEILAIDSDAILLNGYLHSWIGSADEPLNAASIAKGIENHYLMHNALIRHYLAGTMDETESFPPINRAEFEPDANEEREQPDSLIIQMPLDGFTPEKIDNLHKLVNAKAALIKAAIGAEELPIRQTAETLDFPWFKFTEDGDTATAYATLISLLCKTAIEKKRVTAKEREVEGSEKYAMRCFLLSLGMIGDEYKAARKILLSRLGGNSAWKSGAGAEAAKRRKAANNAEEGKINEQE